MDDNNNIERFVVFRTYPRSKLVIALYPTIDTEHNSEVDCFSLLLGYDRVDYNDCIKRTKPSAKKDYQITFNWLKKHSENTKFIVRKKRPYRQKKPIGTLPFEFYK